MYKIFIASLFSLGLLHFGCSSTHVFKPVFPSGKQKLAAPGKRAPKKDTKGVCFSFKPRFGAKSIAVAGTFNGWKKNKDMLKKGSDGIWSIIVKVPTGSHMYKFVINTSMWTADPHNPAKSEDGWGNSMITVTARGDVKISAMPVSAKNPGPYYSKYTAVKSPGWVKKAILYEVFPRVYTKQKGFKGMTGKLPHLKKLGINTIWLMPIHEIGQKKKKGSLGCPYSVRDYFSVNHEYGTKADFRVFMTRAHQLGFRVILDWVANHSAWDNKNIFRNPSWYTKNKKGKIIHPKNTDWTDVADLNYKSRQLRTHMLNAMRYWVKEFGVDGFRCDVAGMVPIDFWMKARRELQKIKKDVLLLAESEEQIHNAKAFDLTYAGAIRNILHQIASSGKNQYNFYKIYMSQKYSYPKNALRMQWLENHDQVHAIKLFGRKAVFPAAAVLLTYEGVPLILMGQEFGDKKWRDWHSLFDPLQLDWDKFDNKLFRHYAALAKIRNKYEAFTLGSLHIIQNNNKKVITYLRKKGNDVFLVMVNLSGKNVDILLSPKDLEKMKLDTRAKIIPVFGPGSITRVNHMGKAVFTIKPWGSRIVKINQ